MTHSLNNSLIKTMNFFGSGGATSAMLIISFGENVLSECSLDPKYELQIVVPNYSEACHDLGKELYVDVFQLLIDAYMYQKPVDLSYACPPLHSSVGMPYLTFIKLTRRASGIVIPAPPIDGGCPLITNKAKTE